MSADIATLRASLVRAARAHGRRARHSEPPASWQPGQTAAVRAWMAEAHQGAVMAALYAETLAAVLGSVETYCAWQASDEIRGLTEHMLENGSDGENADVEPDDEPEVCDCGAPALAPDDRHAQGCRHRPDYADPEDDLTIVSGHVHGWPSITGYEPSATPPRPWRVGLSWGRTIVESGTGIPDEQGRRPDDRLVGVVETRADAERIVAAVNERAQIPASGPDYATLKTINGHLADRLAELDAGYESAVAEVARLADFLHSRRMHPDYEYETTSGPRKTFADDVPPYHGDPDADEGWERNRTAENPEAWERFDYHEESYWRRPKPASEEGAP